MLMHQPYIQVHGKKTKKNNKHKPYITKMKIAWTQHSANLINFIFAWTAQTFLTWNTCLARVLMV